MPGTDYDPSDFVEVDTPWWSPAWRYQHSEYPLAAGLLAEHSDTTADEPNPTVPEPTEQSVA